MNTLVKHLKTDEIKNLKKEFQKLDTEGTGFLEIQHLHDVLKKNFDISENELGQILDELDYLANQKINYTEFIAATIKVESFLTEEKLDALFNTFDVDGCGKIT